MAGTPTIFHGSFVHSTKEKDMVTHNDMVIGVERGKIIFIEHETRLPDLMSEYSVPRDKVRHLEKWQFLMPGLVDTHIHAPQYAFAGSKMDLQLYDWLSTYTFPTEAKFKDLKYAMDVYSKVVDRTLKNGTTTACYFATLHRDATNLLFQIIEKAGQRAYVGKVNMDCCSPTYYKETMEESLEDTKKFVESTVSKKNPLVTPIITPRFTGSCSEELIMSLGRLNQQYQLPVQTHELETRADVGTGGLNHLHIWDKAGLLKHNTVLAHCVYISEEELDLLKLRGSGIAHCPNSNITLRSGFLDVRHVLEKGCKIGLGTDVSGGYSCSMLDALRSASQVSKTIAIQREERGENYEILTYKELFRLATLGGSEVMGLDETIGNFQVGKDFDGIVVDPLVENSPFDVFSTDTFSDIIQKFLFLGDDRNMIDVFVAGTRTSGR
ncbi:guanine deaminase-like isoform X1 [Haliotis rufescens]|uniref:guanine deaminase-like isoform X1 n=2 Tax=Haliotis rufescens TaxID=6454 RepID=UPI00201E8263|nr:guanine deaminase-like isoform X1 [Haliotis rufescens]